MSLEFLLGGTILIALLFYAVLGGADYGGGVWDLLATGKSAKAQRKIIAEAMGPVWEANHVWLILVVVALFTAFPAAFARLSIVFHIPLSIALVGIVLRGCAFTFRHYHGHGDSHAGDELEWRWGRVFAVASLITPLVLGAVVGGIYAGRATSDVGFVNGWSGGFPASVGIFALCLFGYLAATYLTIESAGHPEAQEAFRSRAWWSGAATIAAGGAALLIGQTAGILNARMSSWVWAVRALALVVAVAGLFAVKKRHFRASRALAVLQVALIFAGWGAAQYPFLIPPDITIYTAAAPVATLRALTVALAGGALVLFPSFYYLFYVFKRGLPSQPPHYDR
jgi:cytochrome bd ubiquinol oxidase subunit II